ncbi:MAG: permease prefix domain 1-containing protein [Anaerolineae bacterium]
MSSLSQYLAELEATLGHMDAATRREIIEEVAGHLKDQAHHFQWSGLSEEESMEKAMEALGDPAELGRELRQVHGGATRRDALLAALPPALFGMSITVFFLLVVPLGRLVIGGPTRVRYGLGISTGGMVVGIGVLLLAMLILVAGSLVAAAQRLPVWGYTWTGAAVMSILCALVAVADDSPYLVSPAVDVLILIALLLLGLLALSSRGFGPLVALARAIWRDWTLGSLALFPATMLLSWLFFDGTPFAREVPFMVGIGLLCASASAAFVLARSSAVRVTSLAMATFISLSVVFLATRAEWFEPAWGGWRP